MGFLAKRLWPDPGDRLVEVNVLPHIETITAAPTTVYMHQVHLPEDADPVAYAGAFTSFVEGVVATFSSISPEWFSPSCVLLQAVEEDDYDHQIPALGGPELKFSAPGDSVERASQLLGLTRNPDHRVISWTLADWLLRQKFGKARDLVADWTAEDLVLALLVELATGLPRKKLARDAAKLGALSDDPAGERRHLFHTELRNWASRYAGSEGLW